jgi:uncharacterized membrane protein YidH (DUF202 family)
MTKVDDVMVDSHRRDGSGLAALFTRVARWCTLDSDDGPCPPAAIGVAAAQSEPRMNGGEQRLSPAGRGGGEGVRTRDHLANTRTFLSWSRIGLVLIGIGYVIDKYSLVVNVVHHRPVTTTPAADRAVALVVTLAGTLLCGGACPRFLLARWRIEGAEIRTHPLVDAGLIVGVSLTLVAVLIYLLRIGA